MADERDVRARRLTGIPRRRALAAGTWAMGAVTIAGCGTGGAVADAGRTDVGSRAVAPPAADGSETLALTPSCQENAAPSPPQTEGPYFTPRSPARASLIEPGVQGTRLILEGFVVTAACRPVSGAIVDLWQCDGNGEYDNAGFRLRGHQMADASGLYRFETVMPGLYPGRTRHFHVKVGPPGGPLLTTQLYFPGEPGNTRDGIFNEALIVKLDGAAARFTFVLAA